MKTSINVRSLIPLLGLTLCLIGQAAKADCAGCAGVHQAEEKVKALNAKPGKINEKELASLLNSSSKAVLAMPRGDGNRLSLAQIHEVVQLLRQTQKHDDLQVVIEDISDLIRAAKSDFNDEIKKLPDAEAKAVAQDVFLVLNEETNGNDSVAQPAAKVKKAPTSTQK